MNGSNPKIKLNGFNNLTKSLSCSIYEICWTNCAQQQQAYQAFINRKYNAQQLTQVLRKVVEVIGANVLNIALQDYEPQGASVTALIEEKATADLELDTQARPGPIPTSVVSHLDKSHICVHTYPESHPTNGINTFRADIEVSTCGLISPLKALNFLIHSFDADVVTLDYRVRGFTRDIDGKKHYIDHDIHSIQNFLTEDIHQQYQMLDVNVFQENLFHTKLMKNQNETPMNRFNFSKDRSANILDNKEAESVKKLLKRERQEIFYGRNIEE
ncbi:adenosylmethionine decarboxylase [Saccharobesus litoralis]|uniref:S-adenosylmethionine decarboxylase proenzyme n=1 Tax=Saccharobesus litoralis TaxID=2172099 RepID=A0A2S0VVY6_9ALTE|nr:adenosylmethionine decarboxylase [Saccharobesus litoralis]AWB68379.1 adenosylmethionine decarboxylase [Saccharobesus litoralis]